MVKRIIFVLKVFLSVAPPWNYIEFVCGNEDVCHTRGVPESQVQKAVTKAKQNLANFFFMVGILEQWDDTLHLFEKMMPFIFKDVFQIWKSPQVQAKRKATKSNNQVKMNNASRLYFQTGPLRYEYDVYSFARSLFNQRLKVYKL